MAVTSAFESVRLVWLHALDVHSEAARMHDRAAVLLARHGDIAGAEQASAFAAAERWAYAGALARHPEWVPAESDPAQQADGRGLMFGALDRHRERDHAVDLSGP
jgi:hypothetical protein